VPCYGNIPEGDEIVEHWSDDERVAIFNLLDDLGQPFSCTMWGDAGIAGSPIIIDDGAGNNGNDLGLYGWFDDVTAYPVNVFLDHEMNVVNITEAEMNQTAVNNVIQGMVDNIPEVINYLDDIQPIFNTSCVSCHGSNGEAGLNLTSYSNVMDGSNNGNVISPLDHSASELWQRVNSGEMPPSSDDLISTQIDLIAEWIDAGACESDNEIVDMCGTCDDNILNDCVQDCGGTWGGSAIEDVCGVCAGDGSSCTGCMDDTACNYSLTATINGECEYAVENYDCSGNCNVAVDCAGTCGGSASDDICGICGGGILEVENCVECPESDPEDCAGICGGSLVNDECGVCDGDNSSCTGCMDDTACNYSLNATISGECEYSEVNYDCSGNCNVEVDCAGDCGGDAMEDCAGVCNGDATTDGTSCLSIDNHIPESFSINNIYPNPFNPVVNIEYSLANSELVNISIYDLNGQIVNQLFSGHQSVGNHHTSWHASEMSSGIYIITIQSGNIILSDQIILLK